MPRKTSSKPLPHYHCAQDELYAACAIGYESLRGNISDFAQFKAFYTLAYVDARLVEVAAAIAIPMDQARTEAAEVFRIQLMNKVDECLAQWQCLKSYICEAFPKSLHKPHLESAGETVYRKASFYNWEFLLQLMKNGSQYIAEHNALLAANDNMPATFPAGFNQLKAEAEELYVQFMEARNVAEEGTSAKVNANNDIYRKLIKMFKDGQQIYRHNPALRERFIFDRVMKHVSGVANIYKQFTIAANTQKTIDRVVANSKFTNTGNTTLVVCLGSTACTPDSGMEVLPAVTILLPADVDTVTVLNTHATIKGKCKVRVVRS